MDKNSAKAEIYARGFDEAGGNGGPIRGHKADDADWNELLTAIVTNDTPPAEVNCLNRELANEYWRGYGDGLAT